MMRIMVKGPSDPLEGSVVLSGAKNSALKVLTASVLATQPVILDNIPLDLGDIRTTIAMLCGLGGTVEEAPPGRVRITWPTGSPKAVVPDVGVSVRTSLLFLGGLLGRVGRASVPLPGGCPIGERPFDLHVMALEALGARCGVERPDRLTAEARTLRGARIEFPIRTTGGTENAMLGAVLAEGQTSLFNAHTRPEVGDLASFLCSLGADVAVHGSGRTDITGVNACAGGHHAVIFDNMEAITYAVCAAISGGSVAIRHFPEADLEVPMVYLREAGVCFRRRGDQMIVERPGSLCPLDLSTGTYPGVSSDMQPLLVALATQADGTSRITDIRFRGRFQYLEQLSALGADLEVEGNTIVVRGPTALRGTTVHATDLRGGAAMVAAALVADGTTIVENAEQVSRGYSSLPAKLSRLGARVEAVMC